MILKGRSSGFVQGPAEVTRPREMSGPRHRLEVRREHGVPADDDLVIRHPLNRVGIIRTLENRRHFLEQSEIVRAVPRLVEVELRIEFLALELGKNRHSPTQERLAILVGDRGRGKMAFPARVGKTTKAKGDILEIVQALGIPSTSAMTHSW